jgi:hypothetical protein
LLQKQRVYGKSVKIGFLLPESQSLPAIQPKSGKYARESEESKEGERREVENLNHDHIYFPDVARAKGWKIRKAQAP